MDLAPYVEELRHHLLVAAEGSGDEAAALIGRLTTALESTARLVLLDALTAAAAEITGELAPGSVDVRLRGRDPEFVVTPAPAEQLFAAADTLPTARPAASPDAPEADDGGTARVTLRIGEHLKTRIEAAATADKVSVNSWLVRVVGAALDPQPVSGRPAGRPTARPNDGPTPPSSGQRFTGWAR